MLNNEREQYPLTLGQMFKKLSLLWYSDLDKPGKSYVFARKDIEQYSVFTQFLVTFRNDFIHYHESDKDILRLDECLGRNKYIKDSHDKMKEDYWFINYPKIFDATLNELQFSNNRKRQPRNFYQNNSKHLKPVSVQQKNTK